MWRQTGRASDDKNVSQYINDFRIV
ncbi:hypothetical protein MPLSOD_10044 [Mesorhizobium sp. SOD10]|nr:hypothetical protein MPLSOD_10044 [Mesorhizobium sp. SOD10]